jgi:hypothetical protein
MGQEVRGDFASLDNNRPALVEVAGLLNGCLPDPQLMPAAPATTRLPTGLVAAVNAFSTRAYDEQEDAAALLAALSHNTRLAAGAFQELELTSTAAVAARQQRAIVHSFLLAAGPFVDGPTRRPGRPVPTIGAPSRPDETAHPVGGPMTAVGIDAMSAAYLEDRVLELTRVRRVCLEAAEILNRLGHLGWSGTFADAYRRRFDDARGIVGDLAVAHPIAVQALQDYVDAVRAAQSMVRGGSPEPAAERELTARRTAIRAFERAAEGIGTYRTNKPDVDRVLATAAGVAAETAEAAQSVHGREQVGSMDLREIREILAHPDRHPLSTVAAAFARLDLLEHQEQHSRTGEGTIRGNTLGPGPGRELDCTTYVIDVMRRAYAAHDRLGVWNEILAEAIGNSPGGRLLGTELLESLQRRDQWGGVFWAPDPRNPADGQNEHPFAYNLARRTGQYYDITVDRDDTVIDYRRTDPPAVDDTTGISRLREVPFGLLVARGGMHMAAVVNGVVYEVHWDRTARDPNTIEATALEDFGWLSGAIAAPHSDLVQAGLQNPDPPPTRGPRR